MCLTLSGQTTKPYRRTKYRWKVFDPSYNGVYYSIWYRGRYNNKGTWYLAVPQDIIDAPHNIGFHVFITRKDAREAAKLINDQNYLTVCVKKIEVRNHVASGMWRYKNTTFRSETWKRMKIIK